MTQPQSTRNIVVRIDNLTGQAFHELGKSDDVFVADEVLIHPGAKHPSRTVIAMANVGQGDDIAMVSVFYHVGFKSWTLCTEYHVKQKATHYERMPLPVAIAEFERVVGVSLPQIKMIHHGVGIYSATTTHQGNNPFALVAGKNYVLVSNRSQPNSGIRKRLKVENKHDRIVMIDLDGEQDGYFDPVQMFSLHDWQDLREA